MKKAGVCILCVIIIMCSIILGAYFINNNSKDTEDNADIESGNKHKNPLIEITIDDKENDVIKSEMIAITKEYVDACGIDTAQDNKVNKRQEYVDYLGKKGYTVCMDFYKGNMRNYEAFDKYCVSVKEAMQSGKELDDSSRMFDLYYIQVDGSLLKYHFDYCDGKVIFTASTSFIDSENDKINAPFITRYQLYTFDYTDRGWLFIEQYAEENNEMNGHQAIRVKPIENEYRELCEKYVERIGYQCNNLFISEWNENDYSKINFNDLFEFLYYEKTGEELDHDAFYDGIPESEFYTLNREYFNISDEKLKELAKYNTENNTFIWARIGCLSYSPDISGEPIPEVTGKRENADGTITIIINAVWEWYNTDTAFVQELTVRQTDNGFQYVSNHIVPNENNKVPVYKHRI